MNADERREFLERRRKGIGGSDVASILGIGYGNPGEVYASKVNGIDSEETEVMQWGHRLEDAIAQAYAERTGFEVVKPPEPTIAHPDEPWRLASPDRLVKGQRRGLEIKCVGPHTEDDWGEPGTDEVPLYYLCQVAWYCAILDYEAWDVAALFSGRRLGIYEYRRNPALELRLVEGARAFRERHILARVPPPDMPRRRMLLARHPKAEKGKMVPLPEGAAGLPAAYAQVEAIAKGVETERADLQDALCNYMGDAEGIEGVCKWSNVRGSVGWKAVAAELRTMLGVTESDWRALTDKHRGAASRRFKFTWKGDTDK